MSLLIRNGLILTMNDRFDIVEGDVSIENGRIAAIGSNLSDVMPRRSTPAVASSFRD